MVYAWADENAASSLRVNLFAPGATRTQLRADAMPGEDPMILPLPEDVAEHMVPLLGADETRNNARIDVRELLAKS